MGGLTGRLLFPPEMWMLEEREEGEERETPGAPARDLDMAWLSPGPVRLRPR